MIKAILLVVVLAIASAQTDLATIEFTPGDSSIGPYAQIEFYNLHGEDDLADASTTRQFKYTGDKFTPSQSAKRTPVTEDDFNGQAVPQYLLCVGVVDVLKKWKADWELVYPFHVSEIFNITYEEFETQPDSDWDGDGGFVSSPGRIYRFEIELTDSTTYDVISANFAVRYDMGYMGGGDPSVDYSNYQ